MCCWLLISTLSEPVFHMPIVLMCNVNQSYAPFLYVYVHVCHYLQKSYICVAAKYCYTKDLTQENRVSIAHIFVSNIQSIGPFKLERADEDQYYMPGARVTIICIRYIFYFHIACTYRHMYF